MGISGIVKRYWVAAAILAVIGAVPVAALEDPGRELSDVAPLDSLGAQIDLTLRFTTASGSTRTLGELLNPALPTMLVPVYYDCPRLCGLLLSGVKTLVEELPLKLGVDYQVLTISFDASEDFAQANDRRSKLIGGLQLPKGRVSEWKFLTGEAAEIDSLMRQIGFRYKQDNGEFTHAAAIFLLTPGGRLSQQIGGVAFSAWDVKLALVEAASGAVGTVLDQVLLFCFRFDPTRGKYTWAALGLLRVGGAVTLLLLVALVVGLWRRERRGMTL